MRHYLTSFGRQTVPPSVIALVSGSLLIVGAWRLSLVDQLREAAVVPQTAAVVASGTAIASLRHDDGKHHKKLRMLLDLPGVKQPKLRDLVTSTLSDSDSIIGIIVDGQAFAFAQNAMLSPDKHIVNARIGQIPITVTYCDTADCARVLTSYVGNKLIDMHVGGVDFDHQLVFLLDGIRYSQTSQELPLKDYAFEIVAFGAWRSRYPKTKVYQKGS